MREALGLILIAVQLAINIPVLRHLLRTRSGKGMSLAGEVIWIFGGLGWVLYGILTSSPTLIISGVIAALGSATISFLILKFTPQKVTIPVVLASITAAAMVTGVLIGGVFGISIALAVFGIVQFLPQFITTIQAIRTRTAVTGVSVLGAASRSIYTFGWALYAGAWFLWAISFQHIDWALAVWGLFGTLTFAIQAIQAKRARPSIHTGSLQAIVN